MSKGVRFFLLVVIVLAVGGCNLFGPPGPQLLYEERFAQAEGNSWYVGGGETYRFWIEGGKYHYESQPGEWRGVKNPAAGQFQDFQLKVDIEHIAGTANKTAPYIMFRIVDWDNYYRFLVSPAGTFSVDKRVGGTWTTLKGWTAHGAIYTGPGVNKVAVVANGPQLTFFVNDQQVYQATDDSLAEGQIGLGCGSYEGNTTVHITFDNIEVWSLR
jgi:hypothetical protein